MTTTRQVKRYEERKQLKAALTKEDLKQLKKMKDKNMKKDVIKYVLDKAKNQPLTK